MKNRKRCILITFPMFYQEISLIHSGLLEMLLEKYRVVFLVPPDFRRREGLEKFCKGKDVEVRVFPDKPIPEKKLAGIARHLLTMKNRKRLTGYLKEKYAAEDRMLRPYKKLKRKIVTFLSFFFSEKLLEDVLNRFGSMEECDELLEEYKPVLFAACHPVGMYYETQILRSAKKRSIPAFAIDTTWDMLEAGWVPKFDRLFVWNRYMKTEAVERHNYPEDSVVVSGPLRSDFYRHKEFLKERKSFIEGLGLDPERKLVTIMASRRYDSNVNFYRDLVSYIVDLENRGLTKKRIQVALREKPDIDLSIYRVFQDNPLVALDKPFSIRNTDDIIKKEELISLMNLLAHSDMIISVSSTLMIEACYFDTPVITLAFDSLKRNIERDFIRHLLGVSGTWIVKDRGELAGAINGYLENPDFKQSERRDILDGLCGGGRCDGRNIIMREIEKSLK